MKRKNVIFATLFSVGAIILSGCNSVNSSNNSSKDVENNDSSSMKESEKTIELYKDSKSVTIDDNTNIKLDEVYSSGWGTGNRSLSAYVIIKNLSTSTQTYGISDMKLIKESTDASYTVTSNNLMFEKSFTLEAELEKNLNFSSTIPSDITEDNYKLCFIMNNHEVIFHLYETPDSLREDRTVSYYLNDKLVNTSVVKEGRQVNEVYTYESDDHLSYCDSWKTKDNEKLSFSTIINSNLNVYGSLMENISFVSFSSDRYAFVEKVNHVPSDKLLVIPHTNGGKEIAISNYAIYNLDVKKIYIPNTTRKIYGGNFTKIGNADIYYEGSQEEWQSLFYSKSDIVTKNVHYNTKSPF